MLNYSSITDRIAYVESKKEYLNSLPDNSQNYYFVMLVYLNDLNKSYQPQKVIDVYETLKDSLKKNQDIYFQYGYSYYLLANSGQSIIQRDIYVSRAAAVFRRLKNSGYDLGENMSHWLEQIEKY